MNLLQHYQRSDVFEDVKSQVSIAEVLDYYGVEHKRSSGSDETIKCCFHDDHTASMSVSYKENVFCCHACGAKGSVIDFAVNMEGSSPLEAARYLRDNFNVSYSNDCNCHARVPKKEYCRKQVKDLILPTERSLEIRRDFFNKLIMNKFGVTYLHNRGFNDEIIEKYGFKAFWQPAEAMRYLLSKYDFKEIAMSGLASNESNVIFWQSGIVIPFMVRGELMYMQERTYEEINGCKYLFLSSSKIPFCRNIQDGKLYVFEGAFDAAKFEQITGIDNVMAVGGTKGFDSAKIRKDLKVLGYDNKVDLIYCPDEDRIGLDAARKACEGGDGQVLRLSDYCRINGLPDFKDWGEVENKLKVS